MNITDGMRRSAAACAALALAACGSTGKGEIEADLGAIPKNRVVAELGVAEGELELERDGRAHRMAFRFHHAPAREPRAGAIPIVLVHGTPSTLFAWSEVIHATDGDGGFEGFAADRDVYAIEVIGHGIAPGDLAPYDFDTCAAFVVAATRALGLERAHVVGTSYGGEFAWRAALDDMDRFASVVLLDSSGYPRRDQDWLDEETEMREHWLADYGYLLNSEERIRAALEPHFDVVPPGRVDEFRLVCSNAHNWRAMIDLARDENGDRAGELPTLDVPVLLLWGADDLAYPPQVYAARFHADLPQSRLVVLEDTGHYPHEERPARTVRELRAFFDEVEGDAAWRGDDDAATAEAIEAAADDGGAE